jgi:hypothetical protein
VSHFELELRSLASSKTPAAVHNEERCNARQDAQRKRERNDLRVDA